VYDNTIPNFVGRAAGVSLFLPEEPLMTDNRELNCPECDGMDRRELLRYVSLAPAAVAVGAALRPGTAKAGAELLPMPREWTPGPAEALVKELFAGMTEEQKKDVCRPYKDPARLSVNPNKALDKTIGSVYTKTQMELIERIVRAMSVGDDISWKQITRGGTWDASKSFDKTGANIFGDPLKGEFAFLFTGHHLTLRCDGNPKDGVAFGGPIYYGHTPNGYSDTNCFSYQTKQAAKFYDALDKDQREKATITKGNPGEGAPSVKLPGTARGVGHDEMSNDQKELMDRVMRDLLSPFRKEDTDEVMTVIKETGGMDKLRFAFFTEDYEGAKTTERQPWSFWRIEGPGFIWNFRVLPHVHTYVNIKSVKV
jgi:hypothetical protein